MRENGATTPHGECTKCKENEKFADEQQNEIVFYKKKNKDLTNQVRVTNILILLSLLPLILSLKTHVWFPNFLIAFPGSD